MEESVLIAGPEVTLEGRFQAGERAGGVVIAHPHPLYGGEMNNNVVWTAARAFQVKGWATLRFNFRGVGRSTGEYGEGLAEAADVGQALAWLTESTSAPHVLVGYSFGAAVTARALLAGAAPDAAILISPPIAFMDLTFLPRAPRVRLIVAGDRDAFCPLHQLQEVLANWQHEAHPVLKIVPRTDHFYGGSEARLMEILQDFPLP
jgi:hypothetical protein